MLKTVFLDSGSSKLWRPKIGAPEADRVHMTTEQYINKSQARALLDSIKEANDILYNRHFQRVILCDPKLPLL